MGFKMEKEYSKEESTLQFLFVRGFLIKVYNSYLLPPNWLFNWANISVESLTNSFPLFFSKPIFNNPIFGFVILRIWP